MGESLKLKIQPDRIPEHIAIIMDGNGRWAKQNGQPRLFGHKHGVSAVRRITEVCAELGVSYLTLYAFSAENWNRPKNEVLGLMSLLVETIKMEVNSLNKNNIKLLTIGDLELLPDKARLALQEGIEKTKNNTGLCLILALNYSAKNEITQAMNKIIEEVQLGKISLPVPQELIDAYLYTAGIPDPELLIRTSGEIRISNFLLWQLAYSELYFTNTLWPDFDAEHLYTAILDFQQRERRFGKISEQLR